jgi:hypothetical protein
MYVFVLLLVVALVQPMRAGQESNEKPLEVKLTALGQEDCRGGQSNLADSAVHLKLRLEIINLTNRKLIVSRGAGVIWYGIIVAKDEQTLAAGIYEYKPIIDWMSNIIDPYFEAPSAEFTILSPGKSFSVESTVYIVESLPPGDHVLQLSLGTWFHLQRPQRFKENWKKYGELVYEPVKSEPLRFCVPPETEFAKCNSGSSAETRLAPQVPINALIGKVDFRVAGTPVPHLRSRTIAPPGSICDQSATTDALTPEWFRPRPDTKIDAISS